MRSQSGVAGALVVLRWMVTVRVEVPGFRSLADGTETYELDPLKPNAVPRYPGCPSVTECRVPVWFPTESCIVVPEVSSMCQSAASPLAACTTAVGADVAGPVCGPPLSGVAARERVPTATGPLNAV